MQNNVDKAAGTVIEALADPVRRQVVMLLSGGPRRAGQLAGEVGMSPPAMSRHLRVLLAAGVIEDERLDEDARARVFRLRPQSLVAVQSWLDQIQADWTEQLAAYKRHVEPAGLRQQENPAGLCQQENPAGLCQQENEEGR